MSVHSKSNLFTKLKNDKRYRDLYVSEYIQTGTPFQIRALRNLREWSQEFLAQKAGMKQNVVSRLEDPSYGKLTLKTLLRMASAFDVALLVKFVPFSRFLNEMGDRSPAALYAEGIEDELPLFLEDGVFEETSIMDKSAGRDAKQKREENGSAQLPRLAKVLQFPKPMIPEERPRIYAAIVGQSS